MQVSGQENKAALFVNAKRAHEEKGICHIICVGAKRPFRLNDFLGIITGTRLHGIVQYAFRSES
jgi:hypothetical protein